MATVILAGWREGLQKIALTRLQQELLHLSLREAKENVDRLLEGEENALRAGRPILLSVPDGAAAEFITRATSLGALAGFAVIDPYNQSASGTAPAIQQAA